MSDTNTITVVDYLAKRGCLSGNIPDVTTPMMRALLAWNDVSKSAKPTPIVASSFSPAFETCVK